VSTTHSSATTAAGKTAWWSPCSTAPTAGCSAASSSSTAGHFAKSWVRAAFLQGRSGPGLRARAGRLWAATPSNAELRGQFLPRVQAWKQLVLGGVRNAAQAYRFDLPSAFTAEAAHAARRVLARHGVFAADRGLQPDRPPRASAGATAQAGAARELGPSRAVRPHRGCAARARGAGAGGPSTASSRCSWVTSTATACRSVTPCEVPRALPCLRVAVSAQPV
jgi:hypothetical protein